MGKPQDASLTELSAFLVGLERAHLSCQLASVREGSVMVQIVVPGERWEVEFCSDRPIEVEVFRSQGAINGPETIDPLVVQHGS